MRKTYYLLWAIPLLGLFLVGRSAYDKMTPLGTGQVTAAANTPEIQGAQRVGQSFNADYPGLSAVDLRLTHWGRRNTQDVVFHLTTWPDTEKDLATVRINAGEVERDHEFYRFSFPPIADSQGKIYFFYLESPGSVPGNAVSATWSKDNLYIGGAAYSGDRALEQDLTFVAYYYPGPVQLAGIVLNRMAEKKPWVWGQPGFYVALLALYLALAATFFWQVLRLALGRVER